jgi:hypothetical protein
VTAEGIHTKSKCVATNGLGYSDDLISCAMLKASLDEEVAEPIDHQRVCLRDDCFDDLVLLFWCSDLELLLQKDGSLLVIVADDFVYNVFPVAAHITIK